MAYQNVGTPRFYINVVELMHSLGNISSYGGFDKSFYFTNSCVNPQFLEPSDVTGNNDTVNLPNFDGIPYNKLFNTKSFIAVLGHNFHTADAMFLMQEGSPNYSSISLGDEANPTSVNWGENNLCDPDYNGFSIRTCDFTAFDQTTNSAHIRFESGTYGVPDPNPYGGLGGITFGNIIFGNYFDMPHSPDLNLTMTREYGGVKTIETRGGSTLSNSFYNGNPMWGDRAAWELTGGYAYDQEPDNFPSKLARSGRRIWDLSFSFLQDTDVLENVGALYWAEFFAPSGTPLGADQDYSERTILNHNNFYSQVIHKTNGGQLPFIFQPDNTNNNPDQFAIAKLDMNSFQFNQTAFNKYTVKLKIREVW